MPASADLHKNIQYTQRGRLIMSLVVSEGNFKVLFLIVARGGSKSIPKKNLLHINGISLVGYKAISARKCKYCNRLIVSSDSPEIQDDARKYGAEVPFTRPDHLASDTASSDDVIVHAMNYIETQTDEKYDAVMLLEPSSPFATHEHYEQAVEFMLEKEANFVVGMREVEINSVFHGTLDAHGRITQIIDKLQGLEKQRRQDVPQEYTMNGALYLMKWGFFKENRRRYCDRENSYGIVMPREYSLEIDSPMDFAMAQFLVEKGYVDPCYWE